MTKLIGDSTGEVLDLSHYRSTLAEALFAIVSAATNQLLVERDLLPWDLGSDPARGYLVNDMPVAAGQWVSWSGHVSKPHRALGLMGIHFRSPVAAVQLFGGQDKDSLPAQRLSTASVSGTPLVQLVTRLVEHQVLSDAEAEQILGVQRYRLAGRSTAESEAGEHFFDAGIGWLDTPFVVPPLGLWRIEFMPADDVAAGDLRWAPIGTVVEVEGMTMRDNRVWPLSAPGGNPINGR